MHETQLRLTYSDPEPAVAAVAGTGGTTADQLPEASASITATVLPVAVMSVPTATHEPAAGQATWTRLMDPTAPPPAGTGAWVAVTLPGLTAAAGVVPASAASAAAKRATATATPRTGRGRATGARTRHVPAGSCITTPSIAPRACSARWRADLYIGRSGRDLSRGSPPPVGQGGGPVDRSAIPKSIRRPAVTAGRTGGEPERSVKPSRRTAGAPCARR